MLAIARIAGGPFPAFVVLDRALAEAEPRRFLFGRGCLRENPAVGELQERVARLERLEEDGPAARREGAKARRQDTFGLEDVMQYRSAHGEVRDFGLIIRRHRVHADEAETLRAVGSLAQVVPE